MVARWAHNPKVASSSLASATIKENASGSCLGAFSLFLFSKTIFRFPASGDRGVCSCVYALVEH